MPAASTGSIRAGRAYVEVSADNTLLDRGLKLAEQKVKQFGLAVGKVGAALGGVGAALTAPLLAASRDFADAGSALLDMSSRTGMSVEALSVLSFAAKQTGTDIETVEGAIGRMSKALTAGSMENMEAASTFAALGLSVRQLVQLGPERAFAVLAQKIGQIPNPLLRGGEAMKVFGKSGRAILPMIEQFDELEGTARRFGLVTSRQAAEAADRLGDTFDLATATIDKLKGAIGEALEPTLTRWLLATARIAVSVKELVKRNQELIPSILKVGVGATAAGVALVGLSAAIYGIGKAIGVVTVALGGVRAAFLGFASVLTMTVSVTGIFNAALFALTSPLGLLAVGLTAAGVALFAFSDTGTKALASLGGEFKSLKDIAKTTLDGMTDALEAGDVKLAAEILWLGLKTEWLEGKKYLLGEWYSMIADMKSSFAAASDWIVARTADMVARLIKEQSLLRHTFEQAKLSVTEGAPLAGARFGNIFKDMGARATRELGPKFVDKIAALRKDLANIDSFMQGGVFHPAENIAQLKQIDEWAEGLKRRIADFDEGGAKARADDIARREDELAAKHDAANKKEDENQARVDAAHKEVQRILDEQSKAKADAATAADDAKLKALQDALNKAKESLAVARQEAKFKKMEAEDEDKKFIKGRPRKGEGMPGEPTAPLTPEGLDRGLKAAKVDVAGTFSAAALAGLGAGTSIDSEMLKEQKSQTNELKKLNHAAQVGALVFQH